MKIWHFPVISWFLKTLILKLFGNSITLYPNSGWILLLSPWLLFFIFPVSTIIITYNYMQINKACGFFTILKILGLHAKIYFLIKTNDRLWTLLVYLNTIEQRPNNIVMIGKHWKNQYYYSRLILEFDFNSIKITKIKILRWETDKRWLYEFCNDYTTIEYKIVIDKKARAIEIQIKMLQ